MNAIKITSLLILLGALSLVQIGCISSANLTTGAGLTGATVDNGSKIYPGASVTSANTSASTTITTITGTTIVLSQSALLTGTVPATFKNTIAGQLSGDIKSYTMTAANMAQTFLPQLTAASGDVVALGNIVAAGATDWGLTPTNSKQTAALANIVSIASKVGKDSTTLSNFLTGVQTTGTVSTTSTSMLKIHSEIRAEYGSVSRNSIYDLHRVGEKPHAMVAVIDDAPLIF